MAGNRGCACSGTAGYLCNDGRCGRRRVCNDGSNRWDIYLFLFV